MPFTVAMLDDFLDRDRLTRHLGVEVAQLNGPPAGPLHVDVVVTAETAVTDRVLNAFPALRGVVTASIGFDHLDLGACRRRGITVCNSPNYCTEDVADHALASMLALWRCVPQLSRAVTAGHWDSFGARQPKRVAGSTLGIVGLGRIGRRVAAKAGSLGVTLLGFDPFVSPEALSALDLELTSLEELLTRCDGVSLHAPGQAGDEPLLGAPQLDLLRPGSVLVNVARASLLDVDALCERLQSGRLAGAVLDVWDDEPPRPDDPRLGCPNLFVTPHSAWFSPSAEEQLYAEVAASVTALLAGHVPPTRIA